MTKFNEEPDHGRAFALLFHSHNIEAKFKERTELPYSIIKEKEEKRISAMLDSAAEIGLQFQKLQLAAVSAVLLAKNIEEAVLMRLGTIPIIPHGIAICPTCLAKAIQVCEENLIVLKDIQEATKKYAPARC